MTRPFLFFALLLMSLSASSQQYQQVLLSTSQYYGPPWLYVDKATIDNYLRNFMGAKNWNAITLKVVDATTKEPLTERDGVVIYANFDWVTVEVAKYRVARSYSLETFLERSGAAPVTINYRGEEEIRIPVSTNLNTTYETESFMILDKYDVTYHRRIFALQMTVRTSARGYETNEQQMLIGAPDYMDHEIALIPQIQNVNMAGSLQVTGEPSQGEKLNALNILSVAQVAEAFGIGETEVIKLITDQKLKAKKVGDKYFIRKEDFDEFMKRGN